MDDVIDDMVGGFYSDVEFTMKEVVNDTIEDVIEGSLENACVVSTKTGKYHWV